jgi:hypothetical protein
LNHGLPCPGEELADDDPISPLPAHGQYKPPFPSCQRSFCRNGRRKAGGVFFNRIEPSVFLLRNKRWEKKRTEIVNMSSKHFKLTLNKRQRGEMASFENQKVPKEMLSRVIIQAIQELPVMDREIFVLKHYQNYNENEIARKLSLPLSQVQASLQRSSIALMCSLHPLRKEFN